MWSVTGAPRFFAFSVFILICKIDAKTYYFNVNKTNNEFMVYNRVNLNHSINHYPSTVYLSELRNNVTRWKNNNASVVYTHPLLDPEWNYNWRNITRRKLPPYIHKFYESLPSGGFGPIRIMFNSMPQNSSIIRFNLSDVNAQENVSDAELHFYFSVEKKLEEKSLILRLYQMDNEFFNETSLLNPDAHKLLNVIYILQAESGWQFFKITKAIQEWTSLRKNIRLFITISKSNEEQFSLFKDKNKDVHRTFMILRTESTENDFDERNEITSENDSCRKHSMYVDFEKLNWMKFIVSPIGYNAYNCYGRCYKHNNLPNHIKVTSFAIEIARKSLCCVPISYSPLPIMFYDKNDNIRIKVYDKMVISACGCR